MASLDVIQGDLSRRLHSFDLRFLDDHFDAFHAQLCWHLVKSDLTVTLGIQTKLFITLRSSTWR